MNAIINTKNTTYTLRDGHKFGTSILNGGKFNDIEIFTPSSNDISQGEPFKFVVTESDDNNGFKNLIMNTSAVQAIHYQPEKNTDYIFHTKNRTYTLSSINENPNIMRITSDAYENLEIMTPKKTPNVGDTLDFIFSNNPINGQLANKMIRTSPIQSIQQQIQAATRIKNPFSLSVALAKNKLSHNFHTNHSTYTLTPVDNNDRVMLLSGGSIISPLEVIKPDTMPKSGDRLELTYTNNPSNGNFTGKRFKSSPIIDKSFTDENGNNYSEDDVKAKYNIPAKHLSSIDVITKYCVYTLSAIPGNNDIMMLSGNKLPFTLEVYKPEKLPEPGENLNLTCTSNPDNDNYDNFSNQQFRSSAIVDVRTDASQIRSASVSFYDSMRDAGKFTVTYPDFLKKDFGSKLQSKMSDIANRASEILGLPDKQKQELYFTPSTTDGKNAEFQVGFNGFPVNTDGINAIRCAIDEELSYNGCNQSSFGQIEPIGKRELDMMREALSEYALGIDKQSMIKNAMADINTTKSESQRNLSVNYVAENMKFDNQIQF